MFRPAAWALWFATPQGEAANHSAHAAAVNIEA